MSEYVSTIFCRKKFFWALPSEKTGKKQKNRKKLPFFDINSTINEKWNHVWMFWVNRKQELIKTQFFTKNCDVWSTFWNLIPDFRLKFWGFCPPSSTFRPLNGNSTLLKSKIFAFSSSKNLWGLLGDSESLQVLLWYYTGVWEWVVGPKIGQNSKKMPIFDIKSALNQN